MASKIEGTVTNRGAGQKRKSWWVVTAVLLLALIIPVAASTSTIPTISISSVTTDTSVTITSHNFPANQDFTVTMGKMGTRGVGGVTVGAFNSGAGGSASYTFNIPDSLKGDAQIAIRAQTSHANPYYAYNWFQNTATTTNPGTPGYTGIPTISVVSATVDDSVTIRTNNFPANQTFSVTMGMIGTRGVNGVVVGTIDSGDGTTQDATFAIPDSLKGQYQIAIRAETSHANPYYAYNWFYNNTSGSGGIGATPGYTGIPTFSVIAVEKGANVTIRTNNFPANQSFTVTMGKMYTRGVGGIVVGTLDSGNGTNGDFTFAIPAELANDQQISIRAQTSHTNPYYAYNWFWNNDANVSTNGSSGQGGQVYVGIPTFMVCAVEQGANVTIKTNNFPTNQTFNVTMGPMFTRGINGTAVGTLNSDANTSAEYTFTIPAGLAAADRIAIRAQTSHTNPYYAYNWFWNTTANVCP